MVVVYHAGYYGATVSPLPNTLAATLLASTWYLQHGVTVFFVISGYCIAASAQATHRRREGLVVYFRKRFRRIFPPYWAALALTATFSILVAGTAFGRALVTEWPHASAVSLIPLPGDLSIWQWLGTLTLTEGWRAHLVWRGGPQWQLGQAWTLGYEEQFYAVAGLLLAATAHRSFRWFCRGATAVTAAVLALWILPSLMRAHLSGTFLDGAWFLFAAGILVFYDRNLAATRARWITRVTLVLLTVAGGLAGSIQLTVAGVFALALIALARQDRAVMRAAWSRPLQVCGAMCYSLYLVHWPIAKALAAPLYDAGLQSVPATLLVTIPLITAISLGAGWVFHLAIERRFLNTRVVTPTAPRLHRAEPQLVDV